MKEFLYLYPIPEYMEFAAPSVEPNRSEYREFVNRAIDLRYRQQGYRINYVIFKNHQVSDLIDIRPQDRVIEASIDFRTHTAKTPEGHYRYPSTDNILDQLDTLRVLRVSGFHLWDCVQKVAQRAYERGIDVLVDEDLTEITRGLLHNPSFRIDRYPGIDTSEMDEGWFYLFMRAREGKPWMWQDYDKPKFDQGEA